MKSIKRIIDILMTLVLIPLMAYQVTGESAHEWLGITMVLLVIIHQVLNRKWYSSLFKGNYQAFRILRTTINVLLLISFALTAISGMSMSNHTVPFLYNLINVNTARIMNLAFSYWSFILMGMHIGLHISAMTVKMPVNIKKVLLVVLTIIAGYGFYLFLKSGIINYISFKSHFAFLDYEKPAYLVFTENVSMLIFFSYISHNIANIVKGIGKKDNDVLKSLIYIMTALIIGFALNMLSGKESFDNNNDMINESKANSQESSIIEVDDGFIKIDGGNFLMGSPDSENWRINDELLHEVSVSSFYIDKYDATQKEYEEIMHINPSEFKGDKLPVENISFIDAIKFANEKSILMMMY